MAKNFLRESVAVLFALIIFAAQVTVSAASMDTATELAKKIAAPYYAKATERARQFARLRTFSDHGEHHAATVAIRSQEAADAIELAGLGNPSYSSIDRLELQIAAILHDTGMDGGIFIEYTDGNALRKDHSLNSAIHVLENRDAIAALGVNPDKVTLDCIAHSKSTSGVRDLTSHEQWSNCFNRIDEAVAQYNAKFPDTPIYFDKSTWTTGETFTKPSESDPTKLVEIYKINRETLAQSAALISALRLGDANRDGTEYPYTQSGERVEVNLNSYIKNAKDWQSEVKNAKVLVIDEKTGKITSLQEKGMDDTGRERMFNAAEANLASNCTFDAKTWAICEVFTVRDGKSFPLSVQFCIEDRLGELDSMKNFPVEAVIQIEGKYSSQDKKYIAKTYGRFCRDATSKHKFNVTFEFKEN